MEGKFCYGRTNALCDSAPGWREHGFAVPRVRDLSRKTGYKIFERYEECGLEGLSDRDPPALSLRQPVAGAGGSRDGRRQTRETHRGRSARSANGSCGACRMPSRSRRAAPLHAVLDRHGLVTPAPRFAHTRRRDASLCGRPPERPVVH